MLLGNNTGGSVDGDHRETHLQHPSVHDVSDAVGKVGVGVGDRLWKPKTI